MSSFFCGDTAPTFKQLNDSAIKNTFINFLVNRKETTSLEIKNSLRIMGYYATQERVSFYLAENYLKMPFGVSYRIETNPQTGVQYRNYYPIDNREFQIYCLNHALAFLNKKDGEEEIGNVVI